VFPYLNNVFLYRNNAKRTYFVKRSRGGSGGGKGLEQQSPAWRVDSSIRNANLNNVFSYLYEVFSYLNKEFQYLNKVFPYLNKVFRYLIKVFIYHNKVFPCLNKMFPYILIRF